VNKFAPHFAYGTAHET